MDLKHVRKGKINKISTEILEGELRKLEVSNARYGIDKLQKKKTMIEAELVERMLTG